MLITGIPIMLSIHKSNRSSDACSVENARPDRAFEFSVKGQCRNAGGERMLMLVRPGWQKLHQHPQEQQRKQTQGNRHKQSLACNQAHLVGRVSEETLREQLSPDDDV